MAFLLQQFFSIIPQLLLQTPSEKDKRVMQVFPTKKAFDIYPKVYTLLSEWNDYLVEDFTEEERLQLYSMLERVMNKAISQVEKEREKEVEV